MAKKLMEVKKYAAYYRVSTQRQGASGLGLDAQREAVAKFINGGKHSSLLAEFTEVETGKGSNSLEKRPELRRALEECKKRDAVLVIAKLDRLARNVHFISGLMESKVRFVACDLPEANELTLHMMAVFAEHEAKRISERTKEALAQAKARGTRLGRAGWKNLRPHLRERTRKAKDFAARLKGTVEGFRARGMSQRAMVEELNNIGVTTSRGGRWSLLQLQRVIARQEGA